MSEKSRKKRYWLCKISSIVISCTLPILAVIEHFPLWKTEYGTVRSIGVGGIICLIVLTIIFRRTVFSFMRSKMKLEHAPPLAVWLVMLIVAYVLRMIAQFIQYLTIVFWMGLIGCAIGTVLTYIAEHFYGKKKEEDDGGT